ncbi:MAG: hypothetical protein ACK5MU_02190 [Candidatus Saccharimonadales bacterium]
MKKKQKWGIWAIVGVVVLLVAVRIISTTVIPKFNYDEARRADTVADVLNGGEFKRSAYSLGGITFFVRTDAGFSSLPFLAPATVWAFFFGTSVTSLRIFVAIIVTLALILLAHTIALWYKKSRKVFLLAAIIGLTMPWLFLQGILFWDTSFAPVAFILAFYAFTKLEFAEKKPKIFHQILLPLSLISAVYLYLPSTIPAAVLYFAAIIYLKRKDLLKWKHVIWNIVMSLVMIVPFVVFFLTFPDANTRSGQLNVFYETDIFTGIMRLFQNIILLINPVFLFVAGDPSRQHSIGMFGMLGVQAILPMVWAIYYRVRGYFTKNEKLLFVIALVGIGAATFCSALTHPDAQPHSLRANAAAPFYVVLLVLGAQKFIERHPKAKIPVYVMLGLGAVAYFVAFFWLYPQMDAAWFR